MSHIPSGQPKPPLPKEFYWREYSCPLSGRTFNCVSPKSSAFTIRSRGTDFRPFYDGVNPLHYAIIVSPIGFAAEDDVFRNPTQLMYRDREGLIGLLRSQPLHGDFTGIRDLPTICRAYELALSCSGFLRIPRAEVAGLAMRTSWMLQEWAETGNSLAADQALALRNIALEQYLEAYEKEDVSTLKLGSGGVAYLVAELYRERLQYEDSLRWFQIAISDRSTAAEVLRLARNQMELCREQRQTAKDDGTYVKPKVERHQERSMYQIFRDQSQWLRQVAEGGVLSESAILRGVLDGLKNGALDVKSFKAEQDLADYLAQRLKEAP